MNDLKYYMDESSQPFNEKEYSSPMEDKIELIKLAKNNNMLLDINSELYKLAKELKLLS